MLQVQKYWSIGSKRVKLFAIEKLLLYSMSNLYSRTFEVRLLKN